MLPGFKIFFDHELEVKDEAGQEKSEDWADYLNLTDYKGPIEPDKEGVVVMVLGQEPSMDLTRLIKDAAKGAYKNYVYKWCVIINTRESESESSETIVSFEPIWVLWWLATGVVLRMNFFLSLVLVSFLLVCA